MNYFYYKLLNKKYPARYIKTKYGCFIISTENLNKALFDEKKLYISDDARAIDEEVFFFVPEEIINSSNKRIIDFVECNL